MNVDVNINDYLSEEDKKEIIPEKPEEDDEWLLDECVIINEFINDRICH